MGMSCGITMIKYILFVFNLICALCGIAILALGVSAVLKLGDISGADEQLKQVYVAAIVCIVLGSVIFLIAFFGCCGAINESSCMTSVYSSFLVLLLIVQIVFGAWIFMNQEEFKNGLTKVVKTLWQDRQHQMAFWNSVQPALQCCGLHTQADWVPNTPASCCSPGADTCTFINAYSTGCLSAFQDISLKTGMLGYFILAVAGVELLGVIFACCLANSIRNQERRYA